MKKYNLFISFLILITFFGCQKGDDLNSNEPSNNNEISYSFNLDLTSEFPVGHNLGLNFYNDITVGVLTNESNNIRLITAAGTKSYALEGSGLSNLITATEVASPESNTIYANYVGLGQLIRDSQETIYSVFHSEKHDGSILPGNIPGFYASVGLGISTDNGQTFELNSEPLVANIYDSNYDNGYGDGGLGEPSIIYSKDSTEVYLYYVDHNRSGRSVNISMAKFNVLDNGIPDFTTCYYLNENNEFTSSLIRSKEVVAGAGYSDAIFPHVTYNSFINKYIMVYSLNHYGEYHDGVQVPSKSGIYLRQSKDGINWVDAPKKIITDWSIPYSYNNHSFVWHPNLIYAPNNQSEGYLVYSKANTLQEGHKMWAIKFEFEEE